jgi:hypothetical protein
MIEIPIAEYVQPTETTAPLPVALLIQPTTQICVALEIQPNREITYYVPRQHHQQCYIMCCFCICWLLIFIYILIGVKVVH